ncbi:MAG: trehalose-phosphatase [Rubrobacter sp.]|jgi:trehalose 6-phosphate phosphatase|nr:trehalose-phosphatase [Rubrobacteraceae bacterium]MBA3793858.1 trehalose-phosphatase [Rubrobacter sp.]MDQ3316009.1 trehalose-phosphatase [Actinomycetota bacterium]MDQ3429611.1 trehalose-phosphatase [Actinomycetota bacterium]
MDNEAALKQIEAWREEAGSVAILTDIDGTLAPIVPTPDMSEVSAELRELLRKLNDKYLLVAGISGRKTEDAFDLIGIEELVYFGNHGFEILRDGEVEVVPEALPYFERVQELEHRAKEELAPMGAFVEEKGITASIHYRNVPPEVGERSVEFVKAEGERLGLRVTVGRGVVEARPPVRADKGTAVRTLVEEYRPRRAMFLGDDTTDLDAFRELQALHEEGLLEEILRIGVESDEGPPEIVAEADLVVDGVGGVTNLLRALL